MKKTAEKFIKEFDELEKAFMAKMISEGGIEEMLDMDPELMTLMSKSYKMLRLSKKMMIEQAEALDEINEKLDKLLSR